MKTKRLSGKFWLALTLFSFIGQVAWIVENMYLNVFIYKMFNATADQISYMVAASAVAATVTTILIGALSDRVGKRKLFMCLGYMLWGVSILAFVFLNVDTIEKVFPMTVSAATLGATLTIVLDCIMTFFGSSANDAAFNAWVTDSTDSSNRGAAEGINAMMPLVSMLAVFGGFMFFNLDEQSSWTVIFTVIGAVVFAVGVLGCFIIKDAPIAPSESGYFKNVIYGFLPSTIKKNPSLYITLVCYIVFNISVQIFMPYLIIYYEVSLGLDNYVLILAPAAIVAAVAAALWGKVYDIKGYNFSVWGSIAVLSVGYLMLYFFSDIVPVFIGSLFMMSGYLTAIAVFGAKIRDLTPDGMAGRFQGARIIAQVLVPGVVGPFIGKTVLKNAEQILNDDGTSSFVPNSNIFIAAFAAVAVLCVLMVLSRLIKRDSTVELDTPFADDGTASWEEEHPQPAFRRDDYISLCSRWQISVEKNGKLRPLGDILVPYPPESKLGISRALGRGERYIYEKSVTLPDFFGSRRAVLHFGAVDQRCEVYVNGELLVKNDGGYLPFSADMTDYLVEGENKIKVVVTDTLDKNYPYGKQRRDRGGMWYTPISGIWQPVWIEAVPRCHIESMKITPTLNSVTIETVGGVGEKRIVLDSGEEYRYEGDSFTLTVEDPQHWTPENPKLYDFTLYCGEDCVKSYFALRTVSIEKVAGKPYICLNGKPYLFHGLLDQGYYSDGIYTPARPSGYLYDIKLIKRLGFNMLRKHIKLEPQVFYYYCDKYGVAVFQDMVNSGKYSFLLDTAMPTVGIKRGLERKATRTRAEIFLEHSRRTQELLYNHPSIVYYTIFNEGWGQHDADEVYRKLRPNDPTRVYDTTSGWFVTEENEVVSEHIYGKPIDIAPHPSRPMVLSEFGGYSYKVAGHSFNPDNTYGYRFFEDAEKFANEFDELYRKQIMPMLGRGLCALVMTQVSDVEDETNGLVTYDRQVVKLDEERMRRLSCDLWAEFERICSEETGE